MLACAVCFHCMVLVLHVTQVAESMYFNEESDLFTWENGPFKAFVHTVPAFQPTCCTVTQT